MAKSPCWPVNSSRARTPVPVFVELLGFLGTQDPPVIEKQQGLTPLFEETWLLGEVNVALGHDPQFWGDSSGSSRIKGNLCKLFISNWSQVLVSEYLFITREKPESLCVLTCCPSKCSNSETRGERWPVALTDLRRVLRAGLPPLYTCPCT